MEAIAGVSRMLCRAQDHLRDESGAPPASGECDAGRGDSHERHASSHRSARAERGSRCGVRARDDQPTQVPHEGERCPGGFAATAIADAPGVIAQPKVQWRCPRRGRRSSTSCRARPTAGQCRRGDERRAIPDRGLSGGPDHAALRVLRRSLKGTIEAFMSAAAYWAAKEPATEWFMSVHSVWTLRAGRLVIPGRTGSSSGRRPTPPSASWPRSVPRSARKWVMVQEEVNAIADYQGTEDAHCGLGGQVVAKAGATAILARPPRFYGSLERGCDRPPPNGWGRTRI